MSFLVLASISCTVYTSWAVLLSDGRFHQVWSLALSLVLFLTTRLFNTPFSASSIPLALLVLFVFIICIGLSPAQLVLFQEKSNDPKTALEIFNPDIGDCSAEFVLPFPMIQILLEMTLCLV